MVNTRNASSRSRRNVTQEMCNTKSSQKEQVSCPLCTWKGISLSVHMSKSHKEEWRARSEVTACEVCGKSRDAFISDDSFRTHRNKCNRKMAEQLEPDTVKEHLKSAKHSYQTLDPSVDQLTSETHHKGISEANTEVDVHV